MRSKFSDRLEAGRVEGRAGSGYGHFKLMGPCGAPVTIVSSAANAPGDTISQGWEHVSISTPRRPPNWGEMCFAKALFWDDEETVVQFHPPRSQWINNHPRCLHLFRHRDGHALPPSIMVGLQELNLPATPVRPGSLTS